MKPGLLAVLAAALLPAMAGAQTSTADIAPRTELHAIPTMTLSDSDFLAGKDGKAVTVAGQLRIAQGTGQGMGKLPVVVLIHGSGGMGSNVDAWSRQFNAMGVSTFAIDGFTGRGLTSVNMNQAQLGRLNFILDIYGALAILAQHPRVDPQRIVLMGFSRGGQAALYASLTRFHKMWNKSGASFAAYIPFYPDCATSYIDDTDVAAAPIRIFHGIADDYNPVSSCKAFLARLKSAGRDVELTEYADAQHGFDSPLGAVAVAKGAQTVRACTIKEGPAGVLVNTATGSPFAYTDTCVQLDPHVGRNAAAATAAQAAVGEFVRALFKLK
ncbi:Dienelactone hydrolase [Rhodospirillales bacterium URHD0017]|nr:Dienelactone hydrolase [Rhodospirillales bacterium URHD0017]